jgi:predicted dehydrogenase
VHIIDLARYLMGNPRPVSVYGATFYKLGARGAQRPPADYIAQSAAPEDPFNVEDFATAMIRYEGGIVVNVDASYSLHIEQDRNAVELFGTKGGARLSPNLSMWYEWQGQMARLALDTPAEESLPMLFVSEINHFIACVREGVPCRSPAEDGLMIMRILDAIYESAREGHEVLL